MRRLHGVRRRQPSHVTDVRATWDIRISEHLLTVVFRHARTRSAQTRLRYFVPVGRRQRGAPGERFGFGHMQLKQSSSAVELRSADPDAERRHSALRVASMAAFFAQTDSQAELSTIGPATPTAHTMMPLPCSCGVKPRMGANFCHSCGRGVVIPSPKPTPATSLRSRPPPESLPVGWYQGRGSWRGPPPAPPAAARPELKRSRTAKEQLSIERLSRPASTSDLSIARRPPPKMQQSAEKSQVKHMHFAGRSPPNYNSKPHEHFVGSGGQKWHPQPQAAIDHVQPFQGSKRDLQRTVTFGSRAWLVNNRRWPGWPNPKFTVAGAPAPWHLTYHSVSTSSALVTGKQIQAVSVGKDFLSDAEDQIKRAMRDSAQSSHTASTSGMELTPAHREPPALARSSTGLGTSTTGCIVLPGEGAAPITGEPWREHMLETVAVRKMLDSARAELRQQRLDSWSEASDPTVPSVAVLIETKCHQIDRGGYHGFSLRQSAAKYEQVLERLHQVIGNEIAAPDESGAPSIPVMVARGDTGRERFMCHSHHTYPRRGSERLLEATLEAQAEAGSRAQMVPNVKTDYQMPDNLSFTGEFVHGRKEGVEVCRLGAFEVYLITCQDTPPGEEPPAGMPRLQPYYSLHSKLWTRLFPNADNVLKRCQQCLRPVFQRYDSDEILKDLLKRTEKLHGRTSADDVLTGKPEEIRKQATSVASALVELEGALAAHGAQASTFIADWATKALEALKGLHAVMQSAERHFDSRFDLE